ncbi:hypothetical protein CCE97_14885, partial [Listeria monocytogenes]|nr:hypothetical protein [Listeria monocytogenes]
LGFGIAAARNKTIMTKKVKEPEVGKISERINDSKTVQKNIELSIKAKEASKMKEYLKREKAALEKIKKASGAKVPNSDFGVVQSRINVANGQTRFTPLRKSGEPVSAGFDHVFEGHFDRPLANSRSIFSTSSDNLKQILQSPNVVKSPVIEIPGGQYKRIVDTGEIIGNTALKHGGNPTSWIEIYTDRAGNLITTYPIPKP